MDSMGAGPRKCSSNMQWVDDLSESLMGARYAAWEERYTRVVDYLLDAGAFHLFPMAAGDRDPKQSIGMPLV